MIYTVKRFALTADGGGMPMSAFKDQWTAGGGAEKLGSFKDWYKGQGTGLNAVNNQITADAAKKAATRAATQNSATLAGKKAAEAGFQKGANSVGMMGGLKNTFNRAGTLGKAGMIGAGAVTAGLVAKGLFGGKKDNNQQ
jgi:hypothetical protein